MSKFKPGDKVVVIDGPQKGEKVRTLKNRVDSIFFTNFPVRIKNQHYDAKGNWYAGTKVCLRHATPEEIAAAEKPLRRGDLVMHRGQIGVVHEIDRGGDYWVAILTGDGGCVCRGAEDLRLVPETPEDEVLHYWAVIDKNGKRVGGFSDSIAAAATDLSRSVEELLRDGYSFQQIAATIRPVATVKWVDAN